MNEPLVNSFQSTVLPNRTGGEHLNESQLRPESVGFLRWESCDAVATMAPPTGVRGCEHGRSAAGSVGPAEACKCKKALENPLVTDLGSISGAKPEVRSPEVLRNMATSGNRCASFAVAVTAVS